MRLISAGTENRITHPAASKLQAQQPTRVKASRGPRRLGFCSRGPLDPPSSLRTATSPHSSGGIITHSLEFSNCARTAMLLTLLVAVVSSMAVIFAGFCFASRAFCCSLSSPVAGVAVLVVVGGACGCGRGGRGGVLSGSGGGCSGSCSVSFRRSRIEAEKTDGSLKMPL